MPGVLPGTTPNVPDHWIVYHGDSITIGFGASDFVLSSVKCWAFLTQNNAAVNHGWNLGYVNYGINGQGLNFIYQHPPSYYYGTLTNDAVARVDLVLNYPGTKYLSIFAGTNDIFLNLISGAACWTLLQTYINARISAGWTPANILVGTMLPRESGHTTDRATYNSSIRSNAAGMGYTVVDFAADPNMGQDGDQNNLTYYNADAVHPNDTGYAVLAGIFTGVLFP